MEKDEKVMRRMLLWISDKIEKIMSEIETYERVPTFGNIPDTQNIV